MNVSLIIIQFTIYLFIVNNVKFIMRKRKTTMSGGDVWERKKQSERQSQILTVKQCVVCGEQCVIRDKRINWNIKDSDGDTPIMYCLKTNKMEMFCLLLNSPMVDLNTRDRDGKYLEDIARYKVLID